MNTVQTFFNNLSDDQLRGIVVELEDSRQSGALPTGVHALAVELGRATGITYSVALTLCQIEPLRIAAFRWARNV
jgi:hypothetical protein